jgi:hypothetical protein
VVIVKGRAKPDADHQIHRVVGDLTVLADGRLALMTPDEAVHDLGDVLAVLVGEPPDRVPGTLRVGRGDRHLGRVRLTLEVVDRHERLSSEGPVPFGLGR